MAEIEEGKDDDAESRQMARPDAFGLPVDTEGFLNRVVGEVFGYVCNLGRYMRIFSHTSVFEDLKKGTRHTRRKRLAGISRFRYRKTRGGNSGSAGLSRLLFRYICGVYEYSVGVRSSFSSGSTCSSSSETAGAAGEPRLSMPYLDAYQRAAEEAGEASPSVGVMGLPT